MKLAFLILLASGAMFAEDPAKFPTLQASNLNGKKLALPRDLEGNPRLVLIAFERQQQKQVDTWLAALPKN